MIYEPAGSTHAIRIQLPQLQLTVSIQPTPAATTEPTPMQWKLLEAFASENTTTAASVADNILSESTVGSEAVAASSAAPAAGEDENEKKEGGEEGKGRKGS